MANSTLDNIQTDVQFYAGDSALSITSGNNLRVVNDTYQGLCTPGWGMVPGQPIGRRWPELSQEDTSLSTTAGTSAYTWPTTPVFLKDHIYIEMLFQVGDTDFMPLELAPDMNVWTLFSNSNDAFPVYYRFIDSSGTTQIDFAPAPDTSSLTIRISGPVEVTDFASGSSTSQFDNDNSDRALAVLIAAKFVLQRGDAARALELIGQAQGLLPKWETTPDLNSGRITAHYL